LVTDLPADFEVFGQAVATSMADLLGGTTGQVLAKASNTNMDFSWVTTDDANAIQNAIVDAKGDLIAASANDTPARLAVGNNGETLVADSSTSTGLRYQAPIQQNPILNSAFQVWQRGTSPTFFVNNAGNYQPDRWLAYSAVAGRTVSRQVTGDTTNLPNIQYCARVQRTAANTATDLVQLVQPMETINSIPFAGKTVTLSFYARRGANYSPTSNLLGVNLSTGTGTDENIIYPGYSGTVQAINSSATLTTTWQRFSYTATLNSNITEMTPVFTYNPTGTAGAADYFEVTGVQLEVGSVATPFHTYAATIQGELAACQRYYWRVAPYSISGGSGGSAYARFGSARVTSSTVTSTVLPFPVPMRTSPTSIEGSGTASNYAVVAGSVIACSAVPAYDSSTQYQATFTFTVASGLTTGQAVEIGVNNGAAAYLGFSAEL